MQGADWACLRLQHFAFVGITDLWHASICLFHKQLGGLDESYDYSNVRPTKRKNNQKKSLDMLSKACFDSVDDHVFNCAFDLFLSRILWTACALMLEPDDLGSKKANAKLNAIVDSNSTL